MQKIKFNIKEIMGISGLLDGAPGGLVRVNKVLKLIDKIKITEKEQKKINFRQEGPSFKWDDAKWTKEIEMSDDEYKIIKEELERFDEKQKDKKVSPSEGQSVQAISSIISVCEKVYPELLEEKELIKKDK